jgi:hypothetical protein
MTLQRRFSSFPPRANQVLNGDLEGVFRGIPLSAFGCYEFLSKVKHEASPWLPSLYFCQRLVHLFESAYFRDHLGFLPLGAQTS